MADPSKLQSDLEEWVKGAKQPDAAREALGILFPKAAKALAVALPPEDSDRFSRKRTFRISEGIHTEAYFRLDPQPATWSRSEIEGFMTPHGAEAAFAALRQRQEGIAPGGQARLRGQFLDALEGAFRDDLELSQSWLDAIVLNSVDLIKSTDYAGGFFGFSNVDRLRSLLTKAISKLGVQQRAKIFLQSVETAKDLSLLADVFRGLIGDVHSGGYQPRSTSIDFGSETEVIRALLVDRIRHLAASGDIWDQVRPGDLLWFWWGSGDRAEIVTFTRAAVGTEKGLAGLLDVPVSLVISTGGNFERVNEKSWDDMIDLNLLDQLAAKIIDAPGEDPKTHLALRFRAALRKGRDEDESVD